VRVAGAWLRRDSSSGLGRSPALSPTPDRQAEALARIAEALARTEDTYSARRMAAAACAAGRWTTSAVPVLVLDPTAFSDLARVLDDRWHCSSADLPPQARLHRGPPDDRVRRPRRHQVDRSANRLVNQEIREGRPPIPHHPDPGRTADHHRCRSHPRRPTPSPRRHQPPRLTCALGWPNSGVSKHPSAPASR
jgi:hypothetical protein